MSLILDALRRADSEREREHGAVPGLHAQQIAVAPLPRQAGVPPWAWIAIVAAVGLLAVLGAWSIAGGGVAQRSVAPAVAQPPLTAPPPAAAPAEPPANVAAAMPPAPAATAAAPPRAGAAPAQPVAEPAPWPAPDSGRKGGAEAAAAPPPQVRTLTVARVAPAEAPITSRDQLPESLRAQLPPLKVDGSIYSASAADRSVIIDGRILRENDRLTADLTLEQVRPKSAVLRFKGYRFEIAF